MSDDKKKIDYIQERVDTVVDKVHEIGKNLEGHMATFQAHTAMDEGMYAELRRSNDILQENTNSLKDHMYRTDLLETYVRSLDSRFSPIEMEQLRKRAVSDWWFGKVKLTGKLGAALSAGGAIVIVAKHVVHYLATR
jgi:DNA-directed RNA polymerase sigma subunit (sigma70/sigma32)